MRYPAYLEIGPKNWTLGYVFSLPGLSVRARSPEAALELLVAAVHAERRRLEQHGVPPPADPNVEIAEVERVSVTSDVEHGVSSALFKYELRATRAEDLREVEHRLALTRQEIGESLSALEADPARHAAALDELGKLADEVWRLVGKLGTRQQLELPPGANAGEKFAAVCDGIRERLANLLPGDYERHAMFGGEAWTTRKVLRRIACRMNDTARHLRTVAGEFSPRS